MYFEHRCLTAWGALAEEEGLSAAASTETSLAGRELITGRFSFPLLWKKRGYFILLYNFLWPCFGLWSYFDERALESNPGWCAQCSRGGVCRPVVADSHHFDEEQDPNTLKVVSRIRIIIKVKSRIWIRIKVKIRIRIRIKVKVGSGSASRSTQGSGSAAKWSGHLLVLCT
jgi:hypothetical protein